MGPMHFRHAPADATVGGRLNLQAIQLMANPTQRNPGSIAGAFYVDDSCIDCDLCRDTAPRFFRRNDDAGASIVYHQPTTPEAVAEAQEALENCPTESIGNDGGPGGR